MKTKSTPKSQTRIELGFAALFSMLVLVACATPEAAKQENKPSSPESAKAGKKKKEFDFEKAVEKARERRHKGKAE